MKRAISLLLSLVIILSTLVVAPFTASAVENQSNNYSSKIDKDITMTGNNSLGTMLASEFEEDVADQEGESECGIYGIEMDGNIAYVDIQTFIDATLIVGVFDENTDEMYCSGMVNVGKDDTIVAVKIETETLPQYYMVKAFLVDRESKTPLCKQFECDTYTQVMQEFLAKTVDDFAEEDVLNLDESDDNNFLVYGEDTIVVDNTDESKNVVQTADEEKREYIIENIDDTIASLKEGDIFTYEYGEEGLLIIKVSSITIDGTTATIYGDEITLEEAFDYIKIDTADYSSEMNVDNSNLDEDVEFLGVEEPEVAQTGTAIFDDKLQVAKSLTYKIKEKKFGKDSSLSGNVGFTSAVEFSCYYDYKLFEEDTIKLSLKINYQIALDITLNLKGISVDIPLGYFGFTPIPGVIMSFTPSIVFEGEVSVQLQGALKGQIGKVFENGKFSDDNKNPTFEASLKFEAEVFIGFSLEPKISVLSDVITASMEAKAGVQVNAELLYSTANNQEGLSEKHLCKSCIDGEILFVAEVGFKFSILKKKNLTTSVTPFKYEKKIYDFYYSIDNNKFAFTTCPNNSYKQTIKVLNANGTPVVSATVNGVKTNNNGEAVLYLTKGGHSLSVVGGGASKSVNITVTQSATHTFTLNLSTNNGSSNIISGLKCGANVYYKIYGDTLEIYGSGDMYDYCYQFWRDYQDSITKVIIKNGVTNIGESAFNFYRLNSITIPASVTNIDDWAFSGCSSLTSITIPNRVKRIGNNAFDNCHNLRTIIIPSSVTSIGDWAFSWCESLESITIPNSVTNIGRWAFEGCESLKSATIPASVTSMGQGLFKGCTSLASIKVDSNNKYYDSRNNCNAIIKTSTNTLLMGCKNTVIPNSITSIGARAFHYCDSLTSITIPTSVTSIGDGAFSHCSNLTSIIIPRSITSISDSTFSGCFKLNSVTIPASVTSIGDGAFYSCNSLVSITIPEGVKSIGYRAFDYCPNLTSITIPVSLTSIGEQAFCNCDSLKNIYYVGTSSQWKSVSIGKYNYGITNATIHYNSTKSAASTSLNLNTKKTDLASVGDINKPAYSREHLVPETEAILIVVEGSVDDYEITTESLLYIGQTTADENGYASVDVPQDFSSYNAVALIFGDCDHSSSLWSMSVEPTFGEKALNVCICDYCENVIDTEDLTFLGDVDISGQVDIMDATRIQQHIALLSSIDDKALIYADSSRDGVVSIMDATLVQMYIAQLVAEF